MDIYVSIEAKYGFEIPEAYRSLEKEGLFEIKAAGARCDPSDESYLWVPEMEWMRPQEILDYKTPAYQRPGFVPFAFTGADEPWCWWPAQDPEAVVSLRDGCAGKFDAPNLVGSIYRRFLDYSVCVDEEDDDRARRFLTLWARQLGDYFAPSWIDTLRALAESEAVSWQLGRSSGRGLLHPARRNELVARDVPFPKLNEDFEWTVA
jgi:hypothetical protein